MLPIHARARPAMHKQAVFNIVCLDKVTLAEFHGQRLALKWLTIK